MSNHTTPGRIIPDENEKEVCHHCAQALPPKPLMREIKGVRRLFCCNGCMSVCGYIFEAGLEAYYDRRETSPGSPKPEPLFLSEHPPFLNTQNGIHELSLIVEGIHCSACIWLIERTMEKMPGVSEARVNFSTHRMLLKWEVAKVSINEIIKRINSIGYSAFPYDPSVERPLERKRNDLLVRLAVAGFSLASVMFLADGLYGGYLWGMDKGSRGMLQWISLLLAAPAVFYSGYPFIKGAYKGLCSKSLTMDLTIALGALITFVYSAYTTVYGKDSVYFDSAVMFIFFMLAGRVLEASARKKAWSEAFRLAALEPVNAVLCSNGERKTVPASSVRAGDILEVKPGEKVPLDGIITEGSASIDESMLTGESVAVAKSAGDDVFGSTVNLDGAFLFRVTKTGGDTMKARIAKMVEEAQLHKAGLQKLADRIAGYFIPIILFSSAATYIGWLPFDPPRALIYAVTVLIITCPCALALATPAAILAGCGAAAREGVIVKRGSALEKLHQATCVIFDKTGTITEGRMSVTDILPSSGLGEENLLGLAASIEQFSEHPIGKAVVNEAENRSIEIGGRAEGFKAVPGKGAEAVLKGIKAFMPPGPNIMEYPEMKASCLAGNRRFIDERGGVVPDDLRSAGERLAGEGKSVIYVAVNALVCGVIAVSDPPRKDSDQAVRRLKAMGKKIMLLSGDNLKAAEFAAKAVGIGNVTAEVLPEDKEMIIKGLQERGEVVAMVGDGINDGPALARADVGIAVSGTHLAAESADIVLLKKDPLLVIKAIKISERTFGIVKSNLGISFVYNIIFGPLAAFGYVVPLMAAIAMPLSSLAVVGNSMRAGRRRLTWK